jgi:hypothetical protein
MNTYGREDAHPHAFLTSTLDGGECSASGLDRFIPWEKTSDTHDSSVGIALGYGLDDRGSTVRFPARARNFSLHHRVQNGSGAYPASRGSFPGSKAAGA